MANNDVRKFTNKVYEMMDEGCVDPRSVAEMCLSYMSEAEVADMVRINDLIQEDEDEGDEEEEEGEE